MSETVNVSLKHAEKFSMPNKNKIREGTESSSYPFPPASLAQGQL